MKYYSTNGKAPPACLRDALLKGLAEDGGLYLPAELPRLPNAFFEKMSALSFHEICGGVAGALMRDDVPENTLRSIIEGAIDFDAPLVLLSEKAHVLELFYGPTLAFKDFGARFMARLVGHFARELTRELTVVVATSGDTGGAVAHAFLGLPGIRVVILYPSGKISEIQEKQLTTLGQNITALEIEGTFDDCQRLAKQALADPNLARERFLTSANSINVARLLAQVFYYFYALAQLPDRSLPVVISVPSGNFGNLIAGIMAKRMGLPVARFIAATNANDVVPQYLATGEFRPRASQHTLSNAMDVGNPSNFARLLELYKHDLAAIRHDLWGRGYSDEDTKGAIRKVFGECGYLFDPHSAVGYLGWESYLREQAGACRGIILATAHPAKFAGTVEVAAGTPVKIPDKLAMCLGREKRSLKLSNRFSDLKDLLLS